MGGFRGKILFIFFIIYFFGGSGEKILCFVNNLFSFFFGWYNMENCLLWLSVWSEYKFFKINVCSSNIITDD
jgi:hypothetical protein